MSSVPNKIALEAHRGVSSEYPENTLAAFRAAKELGYSMIELDTKFTADDECVILHDTTLNRTGRNPDGSMIDGEVRISDITLEEAKKYDFGLFMGENYSNEKIPTLAEVIEFAAEEKISLKFDNVLWSHKPAQREKMFSALSDSGIDFGITCSELWQVKELLNQIPDATVHFDGTVSEESLNELSKLVLPERLYVWMRFDNKITSWNTTPPVDENYAALVKKHGKLAVWLLTTAEEAARAEKLGACIAETDGRLKP